MWTSLEGVWVIKGRDYIKIWWTWDKKILKIIKKGQIFAFFVKIIKNWLKNFKIIQKHQKNYQKCLKLINFAPKNNFLIISY